MTKTSVFSWRAFAASAKPTTFQIIADGIRREMPEINFSDEDIADMHRHNAIVGMHNMESANNIVEWVDGADEWFGANLALFSYKWGV